MENKIQIIKGGEIDAPKVKSRVSEDLMTKNFYEAFQLKKSSANAPTYYPKNFFEQIYFYHNGADYRIYFYIDNAWKYVALT